MNVLKKTAGWIVGLMLLAGMIVLFPIMTKAETSGYYEYQILPNETVEIVKYNGSRYTVSNGELDIPGMIEDYPVTSIGNSAFFRLHESYESHAP